MRQTAMPADQRLCLLRDALGMLDPRRHPGVRAETAAMLCETLLAEASRRRDRRLVAEAATVAARVVTSGPLPACTRETLVSLLGDAVNTLAAEDDGTMRPAAPRRAGGLAPPPRGRHG
jgi:hypothetical protein